MRTPRIRRSGPTLAQPVPALVRLWLFRIVVSLGAHQEIVSEDVLNVDYLAGPLGIKLDPGWYDNEHAPRKVLAQLREAHAEVEKELSRAKAPTVLQRNVTRLARLLGLNPVECRLLEFAVLIQTERALDDSADWLGSLSSVKAMRVLSTLLNIPESKIRSAFSADGILARSGLLAMDKTGSCMLRSKLNLLSEHFADSMTSSELEPVMLLRDVVSPAGPANLALQDYAHLGAQVQLLKTYLAQALRQGRRGVNVLFYGAPGTGKTELAKALAKDAGCELFEIASQDCDGDPIGGVARLRAFRAAQCFLSQRPSFILFDEIEDVFDDGDFRMRRSSGQRSKAWVNRILEENAVPSFWLSNSVACLDPAVVRRFDFVIELPVPPQGQREKILAGVCGDLLEDSLISAVSKVENLAPAVVARAASVVRCISTSGEMPVPPSEAFSQLVSNTLVAQGHAPLRKQDPARLPEHYDPACINADSRLADMVDGLRQAGAARLCLYGPPGTGKTAFGRWLAQQLDLRLHLARASDLLSMWVGGTEKNIARAFRAAQADGAMLMIDEVDGFLTDRRGAQRSWEVTAVNEMLTQMESFAGIFVASTNLMDSLDQAALRRFDLKVRLDYLRPEQAEALFQKHCALFGIGAPPVDVLERLRAIANLTPGDFAVIERQHRFQPFRACEQVLAALTRETGVKEKQGARVGFV